MLHQGAPAHQRFVRSTALDDLSTADPEHLTRLTRLVADRRTQQDDQASRPAARRTRA